MKLQISALRITLSLSVWMLAVGAQASSINIDLGAATGYNLFIKDTFIQPGADSQGKIAIGGNANLGQYDVGVNYEPGSHRDGLQFWTDARRYEDVLVVGGNLTTSPWSWGNIKGNAIIGGELTPGSNSHSIQGTTTKGAPIDFTSAFEQLTQLSLDLASLTNTAGIEFKYNNWLKLDGTSVDGLYVTNITGTQLYNATDLSAPGLKQDDTLIINVSGKNVAFDSLNYGARESLAALNLSPSHILYNFYEADNIIFSGGIKGNILAPQANFTFLQGDLSGQIIAKSWIGGWGAQANLWDGFFVPPVYDAPVIPKTAGVGEPSTFILFFLGLGALLLVRRKNNHKA